MLLDLRWLGTAGQEGSGVAAKGGVERGPEQDGGRLCKAPGSREACHIDCPHPKSAQESQDSEGHVSARDDRGDIIGLPASLAGQYPQPDLSCQRSALHLCPALSNRMVFRAHGLQKSSPARHAIADGRCRHKSQEFVYRVTE